MRKIGNIPYLMHILVVDTNSAGIKVKPDPSEVKKWNDLYGEFKKYFKKGKIVIK